MDQPHNAEAKRVGQVIVEHVVAGLIAGQHGVDDLPAPWITKLADQRIDVRPPIEDEAVLRGVDVLGRDDDAAIAGVAVGDLVSERVHEPWMPLRQLVDPSAGRRLEALTGPRGVLRSNSATSGSVNGPIVVASAVMLNGDAEPNQLTAMRSSCVST